MSAQPFRLGQGGLIDRSQPLAFRFNGRELTGYAGDSLASALLANGVHLVARSFKYHRPRGIFGAGAEEPNALVQLETGAATEPNLRATQIELHDGLTAASQNCWPSVDFDLRAITNVFSKFLPAGFYYKTFMWPASWWIGYERVIRNAAGMGRAPTEPDPDHYEHRYAHCDVLIAGAGPAGLAAALAAGRAGARVILADEGFRLGGGLLHESEPIDGAPAPEWVRKVTTELAACADVILLPRATVCGYFDHNFLTIAETVAQRAVHAPRQRLWKVRARQVVLATGAIERPLVFSDNDRPGVMLASAARTYANRYGVRPGSQAVVFCNNDSAYAAGLDLQRADVSIAAIVDTRNGTDGELPQRARDAGIDVLAGHAVVQARGGRHVRAAKIVRLSNGGASGRARELACDLICVAGGYSPAVHLFSQSRGRLRYDDALAAFVPGESAQAECSVGAARGTYALEQCLAEGYAAGSAAAQAAGLPPPPPFVPPNVTAIGPGAPQPLWSVAHRGAKAFVDLQNDVTAGDVALAAREGYSAVEHLKRYTTLGMGTDQGKTSNTNGLSILAEITACPIPAVGTTTFRPPYTPVTLGALAGTEIGPHLAPVRETPMHEQHVAAGAVFINAALWKRPQFYPRSGESMRDAVCREALNVRRHVGIVDVSTLGKIDVQGRDAAEFLERVYINRWKNLSVGRARYGIMLREDGMVFDDGTTTRLGDHHFLMTTTTANAGRVMSTLEYWLQVQWPALDVRLTSVTDHWAAVALAGPDARNVLAVLAAADVSNTALPFMGYRETTIAGVPARIFRISFSGELAYEINVPADYGSALWHALLEVGKPFGVAPYGTDAMAVLRIEKGHVAGMELDGRTTPLDLGLGGLIAADKDFIGKRGLARPALQSPLRKQLVGLVSADRRTPIAPGSQLVQDPGHALPNPILGHVTSTCYSPTLGSAIALGLLAGGRECHGRMFFAMSPLTASLVQVEVIRPVFFDSQGARLRV